MTEFSLILFVLLGLGLVGFSARYRFTSRPMFGSATMNEETNDRWRFGFLFVV